MKIILPYNKKEVVLKEYIPHGVTTRFQQTIFKGVKTNLGSLNPDKGDLADAFGVERIQALDKMKEKEYDAELKKLQSEFITHKIELDDGGIGNMEEANMVKVLGMVISIGGKSIERENVDELHESDYMAIMEAITEIENLPLEKESSKESGNT